MLLDTYNMKYSTNISDIQRISLFFVNYSIFTISFNALILFSQKTRTMNRLRGIKPQRRMKLLLVKISRYLFDNSTLLTWIKKQKDYDLTYLLRLTGFRHFLSITL